MKSKRKWMVAIIGAILAFLWALATEGFAFEHSGSVITSLRFVYAGLIFISIFYFQQLIASRNDKAVRIAILAFALYEALNFVLLVLIWPGAWKWDDINVFNALMDTGSLNYWQGYLTIAFYIVSLFLVPFPAGIIAVQFTIIAVVFGYFAFVLSKIPWKGWKYALLLPFFFVPTLDFNMWPLRLSLYCMLEVLLVLLIVEPELIAKKSIWDCKERCILIAVLVAVLAVWRAEGILYCLMVPIVLFILYRNPWRFKQFILLAFYCILLTGLFSMPQKHGMENNKDYELTGVFLPISSLCAKAAENGDEDILNEIDKVLNVEWIVNSYSEGTTAMGLYWTDSAMLLRQDFSEEDYQSFKASYIKLILRYPFAFLKERLRCFLETWKYPGTGSIGWLYTTDRPTVARFANSYHFNRPINNELRVKVGAFLNAEGSRNTLWMFNYYVQTIAMLLFTLYLLLRQRKWLLLALMMEVRIVLTFLTAPAQIFMYYYNLWLFGTMILCGAGAFLLYQLYAKFRHPNTRRLLNHER